MTPAQQGYLDGYMNKAAQTGDLYHYVFNPEHVDKILEDGTIRSISDLKHSDRVKDYGSRIKRIAEAEGTDEEKADEYWRYTYDKKYKPVVNKPYKNYGVYLTPVDLFGIDPAATHRFRLPADKIVGKDTVLQLGKDTQALTDVEQLRAIMRKLSKRKVAQYLKKDYKKFQRLPAVVYFGDPLQVDKQMLETTGK